MWSNARRMELKFHFDCSFDRRSRSKTNWNVLRLYLSCAQSGFDVTLKMERWLPTEVTCQVHPCVVFYLIHVDMWHWSSTGCINDRLCGHRCLYMPCLMPAYVGKFCKWPCWGETCVKWVKQRCIESRSYICVDSLDTRKINFWLEFARLLDKKDLS